MNHPDLTPPRRAPWRDKWNEIIFGHETFAGRFFDVILLTLILLTAVKLAGRRLSGKG